MESLDIEIPVDLLPAEEALVELFPAIGLTAIRWGQVEHAVVRLLASIARVANHEAAALAIHIADRTALDIILSLAKQRSLSKNVIEALDTLSTIHQICRENRNLLVHGIPVASEPGISPKIYAVQRVTARGTVKSISYKIEPTQIYRVSEQCINFAGYIQKITDHVLAINGGKAPPALPTPPPRPDKLIDTLPQVSQDALLRPRPLAQGYVGWGQQEAAPEPDT